ncbi:tetratricopeptide repeat protein [Prosthecobacter fluviatilis]|uniref:Tetratricopeptide repeat protein n=1 Tax=Prosthecobacter fluviatilis TaxID=445931 RepID=A0ABW0KZ19_9BACT
MICGLLLLLVGLIYWQTRGFTFLNFDDGVFVSNNKHVLRGLTWENVKWSLTAGIGKDAQDADYWRPLSLLSHMLDVSLFGLNAGAHHLMSVALHALTAVALFLVLHGMTAALWRSAFVAALFAVHPLHVESVAWVAERKDVLSGLFFVLALGAYHRFAARAFRWPGYLLMLLFAALAMMSKPMLVTLPCVLLLVDLWPLNRLGTVPLKRLLLEKIPLLVMAAIVAVITLGGHGSSHDVLWARLPWYYRAGNAVLSYGIYIRQTFWPAGLSCFYPYPGINLLDPNARTSLDLGHIFLSGGALLSITAIVVWQRKKSFLPVGWLWYVGMLVPVIGLYTQAGDQAHADRYTYLAMIGLGLMIAWPIALWAGTSPARRLLAGGLAVLSIVTLTVTARKQVTHWRDSVSLWSHAVECNPEDYASLSGLGNSLVDAGRMDDAVSVYQRALKISPLITRANLVVGIHMVQTGRLQEAQVCLQRVVMAEPQTASAHSGLAYVSLCMGDFPQAVSHYQTAVGIQPDTANLCGLGNALLQSGEASEALESYQKALAADPANLDAMAGQGMACAKLGQVDLAAGCYRKVLQKNPQHLLALNNLAWLLATSRQDSVRDGAKALSLAGYALQLPGGSRPHLMHTLAAAYAETGQYDKAIQIVQQVTAIARDQGNAPLMQQCLQERMAYESGSPWRE